MQHQNLSDEELVRYTLLDPQATERERDLAKRLEAVLDYVEGVVEFLEENDLIEKAQVILQ